jgi:uncharacterized protein YgfB (UPF0149 family)
VLERGDRQIVETRLLEAPTLRDYLDEFAMRAGRHLGIDTELCISLRHAGADRLAASSSDRAARCDVVEYAAGAGPCVTAMDLMRVVLVPDIAADTRWPEWRQAALDEGFRSAAGVPAHVADDVEIVLNLYADHLDAWDASTVVRADTYAQQVALTIGLCLEVSRLTTAHADAQESLRELQQINRLVVAAITDDEGAAAELMTRLHEVVRTGSTHAEADVRGIIRDLADARSDRELEPPSEH